MEGTIENWTASESHPQSDHRVSNFRLEFSEGGQWHMELRSSRGPYSDWREFSCERGDLYGLMHDSPGLITIQGEKLQFFDSGQAFPGPMAFLGSHPGALWWLFCSRYSFQGRETFTTTDFLGLNLTPLLQCSQRSGPDFLGIKEGQIESIGVDGNGRPAVRLRVEEVGRIGNREYPARALIAERRSWADERTNGTFHRILCTNAAPIARPRSFRPQLGTATAIVEERVPLWRVKYVSTNWMSFDEISERIRTKEGVKTDFLGQPSVTPRLSEGLPLF